MTVASKFWSATPLKAGNLVLKNRYGDGNSTVKGSSEYIRPSINLKSGIKYITGEGTKNNPYEIN